jgi:RNA polymerase sigma factor (sigma-70 family)
MAAPILKLLGAVPVARAAADADLLARFVRARDESAFAELVRRHGPVVYRVCARLVGGLADDAFQAVFLVLACRADRLRKPESVGSWLVGVAGRVARQLRSRESRRVAGELPDVPDESRPPEAPLFAAELAQVLDDELTRLPDDLRDAVVLCLLQGRTQDEAAAELGGSVRTLRRRLDRAKAILRLRLERRGVVPAVAAGLMCGLAVARAVPPELTRATVAGVREFLAGGATRAPAVLAKEVAASMITSKHWLATACVAFLGLGAVWAAAGQTAQHRPGDPIPEPMSQQAQTPQAEPIPLARDPDLRLVLPVVREAAVPARHVTPNFVVTAPTPVIARAVANEAEYQREQIARHWTGGVLAKWGKPAAVSVTSSWGNGAGSTTFTFANGKVADIAMRLDGFSLNTLEGSLPHEVAHAVLATHFGKPLPRWADEGIALLYEAVDEQAKLDTLTRQLLNAGRGIRLKALFPMKEYPNDATLLYAQGHSVVRFLLALDPQKLPAAKIGSTPSSTREDLARARLVAFITGAIDDGAGKCVERYYGFKTVDALEEAWLEWLKSPKSQLKSITPPTAKVKEEKLDLIPPMKLPGGADGTRQ